MEKAERRGKNNSKKLKIKERRNEYEENET
jgi:hypothetical protein